MKSKYLLLFAASIILASTAAYADKLDSDGILRSDDGSIRYMNQYDAMKACPQGTHLPTIRELAGLSQASGAKGILEMSQVDPNAVPDGYYRVYVLNPKYQKDEFYFSHEGYKRPSGDLGNEIFWSSSVDFWADGFYLGISGYVYKYYAYTDYIAVRCVVDK